METLPVSETDGTQPSASPARNAEVSEAVREPRAQRRYTSHPNGAKSHRDIWSSTIPSSGFSSSHPSGLSNELGLRDLSSPEPGHAGVGARPQ